MRAKTASEMPLASAHLSAGAPNLARLTDGRLVCAFMTDEDWPKENPPEDWWKWWDARAEVKAVTCTDWGQVWSPAFLVASERNETPQRHCAWAGLVRLRDERLLCLFNSGPPDPDRAPEGWAVYNNTESVMINYPQLLEAPSLNDRFNDLNPDGTPFLWGLLGKWGIESDGSHGNVFEGGYNYSPSTGAWCGNTIWQNYRVQAEIKLKDTSTKAGVLLRILPGAGYYECYLDRTRSPAYFGLRYLQSSPPGEQYWETPSSFVVDQWYKIRVEAIASVFYCYLGDSPSPLLTVTCTGSPTGSVGLQVDQGVASFDNVKVEDLGP